MDNRAKVCCDVKYRLIIMDLNLTDGEGFKETDEIMEHQRSVKLGKKRETKKKMLNNYLLSIQGS